MLVSLISITLILVYHNIQFRVFKSWQRVPHTSTGALEDYPFITIIICARNESDAIVDCIQSIANQDYPIDKYECLVMDDHSEDDTVKRVLALGINNVKIIPLTDSDLIGKSFKKAAVTKGVSNAKGSIIVTTDADCEVGVKWLQSIAYGYQKYPVVAMAMPVLFKDQKGGLIEKFQELDMVGMMGVTNASLYNNWAPMANGANFSYTKKVFQSLDGFSGSENISSGDDMFLMDKIMKNYPGKSGFYKNDDAIVYTKPLADWKSLFEQRIRWASKSSNFTSKPFWYLLLGVGGFQLWIVLLLLLSPFVGIVALFYFLFALAAKGVIDYIVLDQYSKYFKKEIDIKDFVKSLLIHVVYFPVVGVASFVKKNYTWKGRVTN